MPKSCYNSYTLNKKPSSREKSSFSSPFLLVISTAESKIWLKKLFFKPQKLFTLKLKCLKI